MAMRSGQEIPERIANAPKILLGSELYFSAYLDLSSDRNSNNTIGWTSIVTYGNFYELDKETIHRLLYVIVRVDNQYLQHIRSKEGQNG